MLNHDLRRLAEQLVAIGIVKRLSVAGGFLRFLATDHLDHVGLAWLLLEEQTLCLVGGAALLAAQLVPSHQSLGVLARDEGALQSRWLRFARWNEEHVAIAK